MFVKLYVKSVFGEFAAIQTDQRLAIHEAHASRHEYAT
jgi:hypothetical protein